MDLAPGDKLGPYEILAPIGAGGMGEVYRARDTRLNRTVAIKRLKGEHTGRFGEEARAIAALNHPNICVLHDIGPDYLVMEYVEGKPVAGPLPSDESVRLAIQIAGALEEAHGRGILHRDLKPANILVTSKGSVKLVDFGLAVALDGDNAGATGTIVGTAAYMSPEQAQGQALDERSDIFSFGAVLYELLTGDRAFGGDSLADALESVVHDEPDPPQSPASSIVMRCLAKEPDERFQSMADVRAELESLTSKRVEEEPSIAVLPFANLSAEPEQEYFSDGLAEEVINALARIPGLRVIARSSAFAFKGQNADVRRIAEVLDVAHILEGSVRRVGDRIRVTAQLIAAADGSQLWSERYDRVFEDMFAVQDDIASAIARELQVTLSPLHAAGRRYTPNMAAYEAYLKAKHYQFKLTPDSFSRASAAYRQAVEFDPDFALAHVGHGDYYLARSAVGLTPGREGMPLVREHARAALGIDPALAEGLAMLGIVAGVFDYDWPEADRWFQRALALAPDSAQVRIWRVAFLLIALGRTAEALAELRQIFRGDPLNIVYHWNLGTALMSAGRADDGAVELRHLLELDENFWYASLMLGMFHAQQGSMSEALEYAERASAAAPFAPQVAGLLAGVLGSLGETARAETVLRRLSPAEAGMVPTGLAVFYLVRGDLDKVAHWVGKAIVQRDPTILFFPVRPFGHALIAGPHWPRLARLMHLPESS